MTYLSPYKYSVLHLLTVIVCFSEEPLTGEHLHRAIMRKDVEEIEKILDTG